MKFKQIAVAGIFVLCVGTALADGQKCYNLTAQVTIGPDSSCQILNFKDKFPFSNNPQTTGLYFTGLLGNQYGFCYKGTITGILANLGWWV